MIQFLVSVALAAALTAKPADRIVIDAAAVGAPISPFIYGQFIEHLGRCIYGGLWAEMLEDRKFFYPVTGEAPAWEAHTPGPKWWDGEGHPYEILVRSPWMILGDKRALRMSRERPLAGAQSVELVADGKGARRVGIMQERLALQAGRQYVGRIALSGAAGARVDVSLVWGGGASARQTIALDDIGGEWKTVPLSFRAGGGTDNGRVDVVSRGTGSVRIGAVSLMPADNQSGWRADTLALLRELDAPVYRWPGGNFVSGYDWRDGVGDRDRRPPRKNPAWKGVEANDVGLHEFLALCALLGAEPYVAVNTGLGDARSAAELVEYANGAAGTRLGRLRAQNGREAPFRIRLWGVGNEMYGDWQLGHMSLDKYVEKHKQVVGAMRAVDPGIELAAVGSVGEWDRVMLGRAAADMTYLSEHVYWQGKDDVVAHVAQAPAGIRAIADAHRAYRRELPALKGLDIKLALDEWNYWYGPYEYGELGTRYFLKDALGIAAGLHELFRQSDLFYMANYAQAVNVIGAIKTTADAAELEPTGLALALYRRRFGSLPVAVRAAPAPLDFVAAWTKDRRQLTVAAVNPEARARTIRLEMTGARLAPRGGQRFVLTGAGPGAGNAPGQARGVSVVETPAPSPAAPLELPPLSVTLFAWRAVR